jgi:hypothetical protein
MSYYFVVIEDENSFHSLLAKAGKLPQSGWIVTRISLAYD